MGRGTRSCTSCNGIVANNFCKSLWNSLSPNSDHTQPATQLANEPTISPATAMCPCLLQWDMGKDSI